MKHAIFLLTALAIAPGASRAEVVDIHWDGDGRFVHNGQIAAGKFVEVCGKLPVGLKVQWQFETRLPVDFNVHYHEGKAKISAANLSSVSHARELLEVKSEQDYCWTWTNKTGSRTSLTVRLQR